MATPATGEEKYAPIHRVCEGGVAIFFNGCCIRSSIAPAGALREEQKHMEGPAGAGPSLLVAGSDQAAAGDGERDHLTQAFDQVVDTCRGERQAVQQCRL